MSSSATDDGLSASEALLLAENVRDLARIIASEAEGENETAQTMVTWAAVNRMRNNQFQRVSDVWLNHNFAHKAPPTQTSLRIAEAILSHCALDISQGATHFYTPNTMPKKGDKIPPGVDIRGGLESVPGVTENGKPIQNYAPGWTGSYQRVMVPTVAEKVFKFYRQG